MTSSAVLLLYAALLLLPGAVLAAAAGGLGGTGRRRALSWRLLGAAPVLSFGCFTLLAEIYTAVGLTWRPWPVALGIGAMAGMLAGMRMLLARKASSGKRPCEPAPAAWPPGANITCAGLVALCCMASVLFQARATEWLGGISQGWDSIFHANAIRFIADTANPDPGALKWLHYYDSPEPFFYPNSTHLPAALIQHALPTDVSTVFNAGSVLIGAVLVLGLAGMARSMGARPAMVAAVAMVAVAVPELPYFLLLRGPIVPNALGLALVPGFLLLLRELLRRPSAIMVLLVAASSTALLMVHPSNVFVAAVFGGALLLQRWLPGARRSAYGVSRGREAAAVVGAGTLAFAVNLPNLLGLFGGVTQSATQRSPADLGFSSALLDVVFFGQETTPPRVVLGLLLLVGLLRLPALRAHWWLLGASGAFLVLYLLTASVGQEWVTLLSRPWWSERWRVLACAVPGLVLLAGAGLVAAIDGARSMMRWIGGGRRTPPRWPGPSWLAPSQAVPATAVILLFLLGTRGLYLQGNAGMVAELYSEEPSVTPLEATGYRKLAGMVSPGEMVMNQGGDGSPWMYALDGVRPVYGHADRTQLGPRQRLLRQRFNRLDHDPAVQAAVRQLHIGHVVVGRGFVDTGVDRAPGLRDLDDVHALTPVYANPDVRIYRIRTDPRWSV